MAERAHVTTGLDCWCKPRVESYGQQEIAAVYERGVRAQQEIIAAQAGTVNRLREQLRSATDALEYIVQIAHRGASASSIGVYAHAALTRMSVAEEP